jgi:hypothetical protein
VHKFGARLRAVTLRDVLFVAGFGCDGVGPLLVSAEDVAPAWSWSRKRYEISRDRIVAPLRRLFNRSFLYKGLLT